MPDNPNIRGQQDRLRINVHQEHELRYWCKALGCTPDELRELVKRVGPMAADVRRALGLKH
jgi:hypothetical protein